MMFSENQLGPASPPEGTSLVDNLLKFATTAAAIVQQQQLAKTNLKLIEAGKQPIPVSAVPGLAPQIAVQGGLDAPTRNLLLIGGGILAGVFVLPQLLKSSRRR